MGHTHSEYLVLVVLCAWFGCASLCARPSLLSGESEVRNEHPVLENHGHPGRGQDGQTCAAQEHPDRG